MHSLATPARVGPCRISSLSLQWQPAAIIWRQSRDLRRCSASCPGSARDAARAASFGILGCSLPSFLTVRNQRPGEKTILSANYHNYSIMAILDEFLMKCALVSSGFHNFQVQPLHSSHLLHKDFPLFPANRCSRSRGGGRTLAQLLWCLSKLN